MPRKTEPVPGTTNAEWQALLANAARLDPERPVLPSFPRILGQLSPIEVVV